MKHCLTGSCGAYPKGMGNRINQVANLIIINLDSNSNSNSRCVLCLGTHAIGKCPQYCEHCYQSTGRKIASPSSTHNSCVFNCGKCPPHTVHTCQNCFQTNSHRTVNCPKVAQTQVVLTGVVQPQLVFTQVNRAQSYGIGYKWQCFH